MIFSLKVDVEYLNSFKKKICVLILRSLGVLLGSECSQHSPLASQLLCAEIKATDAGKKSVCS